MYAHSPSCFAGTEQAHTVARIPMGESMFQRLAQLAAVHKTHLRAELTPDSAGLITVTTSCACHTCATTER